MSTRINHLKAALDPAQYLCITPLYLGSVSSDEHGDAVDSEIADMFDRLAEAGRLAPEGSYAIDRKGVKELVAERGINGRFASKGTCDHCGAAFKFGYIFEHVVTKQVIAVGRTCGTESLVDSKASLAMQRLEKSVQAARASAKLKVLVAEFLAKHEGLAEALKGEQYIITDINRKLKQYGSISAAQVALVMKVSKEVAERAERRAEAAAASTSAHVGTPGERLTLELTLDFVTSFDGAFGTTYINKLSDAAGNVLVHKGSVDLRCYAYNASGDYVPTYGIGDKLTVTGTVKEHSEYNGIKQTLLLRPKVKS